MEDNNMKKLIAFIIMAGLFTSTPAYAHMGIGSSTFSDGEAVEETSTLTADIHLADSGSFTPPTSTANTVLMPIIIGVLFVITIGATIFFLRKKKQ